MKYKVGDNLKIVKNLNGHEFLTGEIVTVKEVCNRDQDYKCNSKRGGTWYVRDEEVEPAQDKFPNAMKSYLETFYEVVSALTLYEKEGKDIKARVERGTGGMYELAEDLTDEFEVLNADRDWDGEFFDEIEEFMVKKSFEFLVS